MPEDYPRQCCTCNASPPVHCEGRSPKCQCYCTRNDPVVARPPQLDVYRASGTWYKPPGARRVTMVVQAAGDGKGVLRIWKDAAAIPDEADVILTRPQPRVPRGLAAGYGDNAVIADPTAPGQLTDLGFAAVITEF